MENLGILRILTCGSVDNGKSTLIGRLLFDSDNVQDDQLAALENDSRKYGTRGKELDLALLLDGLESERQQGITIDVSYRYFSTGRRRFIVADCPGHEQYTRNMATGASNSSLALIVLDAKAGPNEQIWRHLTICHLMGIEHVIFAANKIDLVGFSSEHFERIRTELMDRAQPLGFKSIYALPVCAVSGNNVVRRDEQLDWHQGPCLLAYLEGIDTQAGAGARASLRLPVQFVSRPNSDFRGYAGTISAGVARVGQALSVIPTTANTRIARIFKGGTEVDEANVGDAVMICVTDDVDISRGFVLSSPDNGPTVSDHVAADIVWFSDKPFLPQRQYLIQCGHQLVRAWGTNLKYKLDVQTQEHLAAKQLSQNEIGRCDISFSHPLIFDPFDQNANSGGFILIDHATSETMGCGLIRYSLRRSTNVAAQSLSVSPRDHAHIKGHRACCIWFTGLSGAGKSTIANLLEYQLNGAGVHTALLDGDNLRLGINRDLGFTEGDRVENIRRLSAIARLMVDAGLIVIVAAISPFEADRQAARALFSENEFFEVFVDTPLDVCESRDAKGLYKKARAGLIPNFTGVTAPYERPQSADLVLPASHQAPGELASRVKDHLAKLEILS
ncbi:adenylyl-sulfate kinase [Bradyrhizobium diazoefficiens]|nr:adenylyl-sulfate kinase [Bradyrhizobium diazoefficiens]MBR0704812.1 adenylyl-sulfate kinase [Bradyrhizobium diazoefficiens]MBR0773161.1 adenylyl-sulfate kinase [Bradyrhizobium diazoefficiens]